MIRALIFSLMLVGWVRSGSTQTTAPNYKRTTIESILRSGKKADGKRVEMEGSVTTGFETSIFQDGSICGHDTSAHECAIWLKFGNCRVAGGLPTGETCGELVTRLSRQSVPGKDDLRLITLPNITVRGRISTVRADIKYDKSVPKSVRIGFGHLGAYPAELQLEEIEVRHR